MHATRTKKCQQDSNALADYTSFRVSWTNPSYAPAPLWAALDVRLLSVSTAGLNTSMTSLEM